VRAVAPSCRHRRDSWNADSASRTDATCSREPAKSTPSPSEQRKVARPGPGGVAQMGLAGASGPRSSWSSGSAAGGVRLGAQPAAAGAAAGISSSGGGGCGGGGGGMMGQAGSGSGSGSSVPLEFSSSVAS
jgi:hypothetical protein